MSLDYIIVGQGLAGTALAYTLLKRGKKLLVVDKSLPNTPSKVAAGLFNPITGRNMTQTWLGNQLFPFLHHFYGEMEKELDARFFFPTLIYVPFDSIEKQNTWVAKSGDFLGAFHTHLYQNRLKSHYGGMEIRQSGYVLTKVLLEAFSAKLFQLGMKEEGWLDPQAVEVRADGVHWKGIHAKKIVFCDGPANAQNPFFPSLDYRPAKGEILDLQIEGEGFSHILNRGCWVVPLGGNVYRAGSNYERSTDPTPSAHGRGQVLEALDALLNVPYQIVGHEAGIRPATYDRRPFIGTAHPCVAMLGGLGSKGTSLAPFFSKHLTEHLEDGVPLMKEVWLGRK